MSKTPQEFLDDYWDGSVPVNVETMLNLLGFEVNRTRDLGQYKAIVNRIPDLIDICGTIDPVEERFILAHILGHIVTDHRRSAYRTWYEEKDNFTTSAPPEEMQANKFAEALLVPLKVLSFYICKYKAKSLEDVASTFGVSEVLAARQIRSLK